MSTSRESRNSDRHLLIKVMEHYGVCLNEVQKARFMEMPSSETVRRIRQKFQESGKYLADQRVGAERRYKGYRMQQTNPVADKVENLMEQRVLPWGQG